MQQRPADRGRRVDVDARPGVGDLGDDARDERDALRVDGMGDAVDGEGLEARVGEDDLGGAVGRRVAGLDGLGVEVELLVDGGQHLHEPLGELVRGVGEPVAQRREDRGQGTAACLELGADAGGRARGLAPVGEEQRHHAVGERRDELAIGQEAVDGLLVLGDVRRERGEVGGVEVVVR